MTDRANAERQKRWRDRQRGGPPRAPGGHGTTGSYRRGCRCDACRASWADYIRARRQASRAERDHVTGHSGTPETPVPQGDA